jgi:hypothetical protein
VPSREYRLLREMQGRPLTDDRKGDRHKNRNNRHDKGGHTKSKWERRVVVAWDGEGANLDSGEHIYNLLANSNGHFIRDDKGLDTTTVFEFFLKYSDPKDINVIYGGSYDVNMFLRDLPIPKLEELWMNGTCVWKDYQIHYAHRKKFTVSKLYRDNKAKLRKDTFVLWDVLGYFQATFVNACRKWLGDLPILDKIEDMKWQRSEFTTDRINDIVEYNRMECQLLVQLMTELFKALDECDIQLKRYDGAGSIAAALLQKYNVKDYMGEAPKEVLRIAQYCYSGGRIEAPKIGTMEGDVYRYDINSAYPAASLELPSYRGAVWHFDSEWDGSDNSMVHIRWNFKPAPFYPLWYRERDGTILYPRSGEGWYFGSEIRNVVEFHAPETYEISEAVNVTLTEDYHPFSFIGEVYEHRKRYKAVGSMASEALKLGMNSTYGKLAQQAGYRNGRIPTYHHLIWAGQITSKTRATMYRAAIRSPRDVIAFATDALITTKPRELPFSKELGAWTPERFSGITVVQPGVYWLNTDGEWNDKYRGFDKGSLSRVGIVEAWERNDICPIHHTVCYPATLTRFVGMGSALAGPDQHKKWRSWDVQERHLDLIPGGKRVPSKNRRYSKQLCVTMAAENYDIDGISKPYALEWIDEEEVLRPKEQGIDIRVIEEELLDSYA